MHLIADIGGTNARFALVDNDGAYGDIRRYACEDFDGPAAAAKAYLADINHTDPLKFGAFCVACPVLDDQISLTNNAWDFSTEQTRLAIGIEYLKIVNDFTAQALSVLHLGPQDKYALDDRGTALEGAPIAVVGPGTGLGVSGLVQDIHGQWIPLAGEGGHVTFSPRTEREFEVYQTLATRFGHVSAERLASGPGLVNLYQALRLLEGLEPKTPSAEDVMTMARKDQDPFAVEALDLFTLALAGVASDLVVTLGAKGGVYIGGGIPPKALDYFKNSPYLSRFRDKGRFADYLATVPTWIITHDYPAFLGLAGIVRSP